MPILNILHPLKWLMLALRDYKIEVVNNQHRNNWSAGKLGKKKWWSYTTILEKIIIGCNEMPLEYLFNDDNTTNPQGDNGFTVTCRGNLLFKGFTVICCPFKGVIWW
jgi:hypothetical protein